MARKHFQDFAYVLCQKFLATPSNRDLVNLAIFGDGVLELRITENKATHNGFAVEPLPYAREWLAWAEERMDALRIPREELHGAVLRVDYTVALRRPSNTLRWLGGDFNFHCTAVVAAADREYRAALDGESSLGFGQV